MRINFSIEVQKHGFNPRGGGVVRVSRKENAAPHPLLLVQQGRLLKFVATVDVAASDEELGQKHASQVASSLRLILQVAADSLSVTSQETESATDVEIVIDTNFTFVSQKKKKVSTQVRLLHRCFVRHKEDMYFMCDCTQCIQYRAC